MIGVPDTQVAEAVMSYITGARWFAGKGRLATLRSMTPLPWLNEVSEFFAGRIPAVRVEIAELEYDDGPREFYSLAVSYRSAPDPGLHYAEIARVSHPDLGSVVAYDAARDPEACRVLLRALLEQKRLTDRDTTTTFHLTGREGLSQDLEPRVFPGQQSNTSVMFGDVAIVKLFRRLELGRNLDIRVHDALNRAGVRDVAGLFGWAEGSWNSGGVMCDADLAMVVEMLRGAVDGWELALDQLRARISFADQAEALGKALAETHAALQQAFPTADIPGAGVAATMKDRLRAAAAIAPALLPYAEGLTRRFDELGTTTLATQRVHGDFHLGQTLHTPDGWKIIDFEGEPAKTMAERLAPDSVWRDVAGMLRSFDYAAASVPGPTSEAWAEDCRQAFLGGYADGELHPADAATVRAYEADKAIYEVIYEMRNRPDWVSIPLAAVATLAQTAQSNPRGDTPQPPESSSTKEWTDGI